MKINKTKLRKAFNLQPNLAITPSWVGNGEFMIKRSLPPVFNAEASMLKFFKVDTCRTFSDARVESLYGSTSTHQIYRTNEVHSKHFGDKRAGRKYLDESNNATWLNETYAELFQLEIGIVCKPTGNVVDDEYNPSFILCPMRAPK